MRLDFGTIYQTTMLEVYKYVPTNVAEGAERE